MKKIQEKKEHPIVEMLCTALVSAVVVGILSFSFKLIVVSGESMNDTYQNGNMVIIKKNSDFSRGDVVVFQNDVIEQGYLIKRVIATEGDTLDIDFDTGKIVRNGAVLNETYIKEKTTTDEGGFSYPVTVPEGCIFVMGDNRNHSIDSRDARIGFVSVEDVKGKVLNN